MEELEARGHIIVKRCLLLERALAVLGDDGHRELLCAHVPDGAFDVYDGRRAEEALFAAVRLLRDGRVQADDGGHGHDARRVLRDVVADDAANLAVRVLRLRVGVELALAGGRLDGFSKGCGQHKKRCSPVRRAPGGMRAATVCGGAAHGAGRLRCPWMRSGWTGWRHVGLRWGLRGTNGRTRGWLGCVPAGPAR